MPDLSPKPTAPLQDPLGNSDDSQSTNNPLPTTPPIPPIPPTPTPSPPSSMDEEKKKEQEEIEKGLKTIGVGGKGTAVKVALATLVFLFISASIPAAVFLARQRQEIRSRAAPGVQGDMTCLGDDIIGPGAYAFAANGAGLENTSSTSFTVTLPSGATPLANHAYLFWSGEKPGNPSNPNSLTLNGQVLSGEEVYKRYNDDWNVTGYIFRAKIPASLVSGTSLTFNVSGLSLPVGKNKLHSNSEPPGAHGVGAIIPYQKAGLPNSKVIIKSCGDFVYHSQTSDDWSDQIKFDLPDISGNGAALRAAFFFGEGEGNGHDGEPRPNYLNYNGNRLNPTSGCPSGFSFPACSSDSGYWWDTRVTGNDLPAITASGTTAVFRALSPRTENGQEVNGDSFYFIGGVLQYPVSPPTTGTPTPTPTSPPGPEASCTNIKLINLNGSPKDPLTLKPGDQGYIDIFGNPGSQGSFLKARARIRYRFENSNTWQSLPFEWCQGETEGNDEWCYQDSPDFKGPNEATIPFVWPNLGINQTIVVLIEAELLHSDGNWY